MKKLFSLLLVLLSIQLSGQMFSIGGSIAPEGFNGDLYAVGGLNATFLSTKIYGGPTVNYYTDNSFTVGYAFSFDHYHIYEVYGLAVGNKDYELFWGGVSDKLNIIGYARQPFDTKNRTGHFGLKIQFNIGN